MSNRKLFAVAGDPVLHSLSPRIFRAAYHGNGQKGWYSRIAAQTPGELINIFTGAGLSGMNITAPFKESIIDFLDQTGRDADAIGAVNTVIVKKGLLSGSNTDHTGVSTSLHRAGIPLEGRTALVLGAGGAGRAAAYALTRGGANVTMVNRSRRNGTAAAGRIGCRYEPPARLPAVMESADIVVSALPPGVDLLDYSYLHSGVVVLDANYTGSTLSAEASRRGCTVIGGGDWLINQAVPAFRRFTGSEPDRESMYRALSGFRKEEGFKNISLVGFMGCGKTTVGRLLARSMNLKFTDTDIIIREREGMEIREIFSSRGERYFRKLEEEVIREVSRERGQVISCGGGSLIRSGNRKNLRENSTVVWLYNSPEGCVERIGDYSRPLLRGAGSAGAVRELFRSRREHYSGAADLVIASDREPPAVAERIANEINKAFGN